MTITIERYPFAPESHSSSLYSQFGYISWKVIEVYVVTVLLSTPYGFTAICIVLTNDEHCLTYFCIHSTCSILFKLLYSPILVALVTINLCFLTRTTHIYSKLSLPVSASIANNSNVFAE